MTQIKKPFSKEILFLKDIETVIDQITNNLKENVYKKLARRGGVVGISGGIDSSLTLAISAKAFGPERVLGVMLPEKDSSPESLDLAIQLAQEFGVKTVKEEITQALSGFGCYKRRDEAVKRVIPKYDPKIHKFKIGIKQDSLKSHMPPIFSVTLVEPDGKEDSKVLPLNEYLEVVASSNLKQRSRMSMLYYHAERLHYAVIGTPNKHEVAQGFFVKYGDGGADVMPIANLYKTQVYQIAEYLGVPEEILKRTPTTDTYTAEQTQEEFFFQLPFELMDLIWYGWENGYESEEVAETLSIDKEQIQNVYRNFERKKKTTDYLRRPPIIDEYII
jgi:NAD+ synthase